MWLRKKSGAIRRNHMWPSRRARKLANATLRCDVEQQELVRWRGELVKIIQSAQLPICAQVCLTTNPEGAAHASTIRSQVQEWKPGQQLCYADFRVPMAKSMWVSFWITCMRPGSSHALARYPQLSSSPWPSWDKLMVSLIQSVFLRKRWFVTL